MFSQSDLIDNSLRGGEVPNHPFNDGSEGGTSCPPLPCGKGEVVMGQEETEFGRQLQAKTSPPQQQPPGDTDSGDLLEKVIRLQMLGCSN